jgi:PAS domain S-box-containing protein
MQNLLNSLRIRLLLGYMIPTVLFLGVAVVSFVTIQRLRWALEQEKNTRTELLKIHEVKESITAMSAAKNAYYILGDKELGELGAKDLRNQFLESRKKAKQDLQNLRQLVLDEKRLADLDELERLESNWYSLALSDFNLKPVAGLPWVDKISRFKLNEGLEALEKIRFQMDQIIAAETDLLERQRTEVENATWESLWAILISTLLSVIFSLTVSLLSARSIAQPVGHLHRAVTQMRHGKFEAVLPYGPTEVSDLMRGFNLMGIALAERNTLLENSELRYRTIVATTSNLLWTTDADGNHTEMHSWCAYTGQCEKEVIGDGWLDAIHPEDRDGFISRWTEAQRSKKFIEDQIRIRGKEGAYRNFACISVPILNEKDDVIEWVRICADITERKQEEQLRQEKEAAEAANRAKSEFLAKMSHELRTPLNAVIGMSKMLSTRRFGDLNDKQLDYLSDITNSGEHLLDLINDILDLTKVEAGRMELSVTAVAVASTVDMVLSTLRPLAEAKKLEIRRELVEEEGQMLTDLARFKQILYNLLSNAVKFTPEKGTITLRAKWMDGVHRGAHPVPRDAARGIRIDVEDNGIGIARKDQAKLGTDFFQAKNPSLQTQEGTGLGVALTQRLTTLLGGEFWFTSELGQGSCFSFVLPVQMADMVKGEKREAPRPFPLPTPAFPVEGGRSLVLIIDDHVPTNKLLADWLHEAGLETASAFDGESGLEEAVRLKPQLILMDIMLPRINGLQLLSLFKEDPVTAGLPVAVISVLEHTSTTPNLKMLDWFVKPVDKDNFLSRLRMACPELFAGE